MLKEQPNSTNNNNQLKMDFNIDLSLFSSNIKSNFTLIWDMLNKHAQQLQIIKIQIQKKSPQYKSRKQSRQSNKNSSKIFSLNYSNVSDQGKDIQNQLDNVNPQNSFTDNNQANINMNMNKQQIKTTSQQNQIKSPQIQNKVTNVQQNKQQNSKIDNDNDNKIIKLIQTKISQMNERLQKVQLTSIRQSSNTSKKMNQLKLQLQNNINLMDKKQSQIKKLQFQIEKFRGQLSQYKLKKQSQLMRISANNNSSSNNNNNTSNQYNQFLLQKIQQISNCIPQLVLITDFNQYKSQIKLQINRIQRKLEETVSNQQFNGLLNILSKKKNTKQGKKQEATKINKNQNQKENNKDKIHNIDHNIIQQNDTDPILQYKLISLQKSLKQLNENFKILTQTSQYQNQKHNKKQLQLSQQIQNILSSQARQQQKSGQHETFMRNMNQSYNQKIKQIISQIVQTQQSIQKLSNQMKFYAHTSNKSQGQVSPTANSSGMLIEGGKVIDIQNDMNNLKKKVNKLTLKMQSVKQQILNARQDFVRDCDGIKANLQKKCDWQSLKKGLNYFEQRVKQLVIYVQSVQKSIMQNQDNGQSTAAKRGWTCLCCDKDIKQFQGKLSQAKFTSIFPARYQSPRIGGYYKQKQSNKEYNQVFLKHNRRLSQNQTKSKDQI